MTAYTNHECSGLLVILRSFHHPVSFCIAKTQRLSCSFLFYNGDQQVLSLKDLWQIPVYYPYIFGASFPSPWSSLWIEAYHGVGFPLALLWLLYWSGGDRSCPLHHPGKNSSTDAVICSQMGLRGWLLSGKMKWPQKCHLLSEKK